MPRYRWIEPHQTTETSDLATLGLLGDILANRGVATTSEAVEVLSRDGRSIPDPSTLPDIEPAARRIREAIDRRERIAIFGDYDVDGVTSTTVLLGALTDLGGDVRPYLPHRERDGYGLNTGAVEAAAHAGCSLLITVDCGTGNRAELEYARVKGLDAIVIDHHHVSSIDLPVTAFVSPKRPDSAHPFDEYAAVGVTYQLCRYLAGDERVERLLPCVALGTVADVVPLTGPNRVLVHQGLGLFPQYAGPGLLALAEVASIDPAKIGSHHLGFMLGPRINAAGRIDDPQIALELLLTDSPVRASELAHQLDGLNRHRQQMLNDYVSQAVQYAEDDGILNNPVLVVGDPDWHIGLVGLIASRLSEQFSRPVFALNQSSPESRGSARSIDEFNVIEALHRCADLLERFGGHSKAAGFTIRTNNIQAFDDRINQVFLDEVGPELPLPALHLDAELHPDLVSLDLLDDLKRLEPCGHGNPTPKFLMRDVVPFDLRRVGDQRHLRFKVRNGLGRPHTAISFGSGDRLSELDGFSRVDLALSLRPNTFRGRTSVDLEVIDFRSSE